MTKITDAIQKIADTPKPTKCETCIALANLDRADIDALHSAHDAGTLTGQQFGAILAEHAGYTGSIRHSPARHLKERHMR